MSRIGKAVLVVLGFVALLVILELASLHAVTGNSDGATVILQGQAMRQGHLTLSGWSLSYDSFWSIDAPFYLIAVLIFGLHAYLLNAVPVVIAAMVIIVGITLARDHRRGLRGAAGAATVVFLLALPTPSFARFFLQGPLHDATTLWVLVAFAALCRRRSWAMFLVATLALAAGILGDFQTVLLGIFPVGIAGVVDGVAERRWRAGLYKFTAAVAAVALAIIVRVILVALGTFSVGKSNPIATWPQFRQNVREIASRFGELSGVGTVPDIAHAHLAPLVQIAHVLGLVVVLASVVVALVGLVRAVVGRTRRLLIDDPGSLDDLLVLAFCGDGVLFLAFAESNVGAFARYLVPAVIIGAILAGRMVARHCHFLARRNVAAIAGCATLGAASVFGTLIGFATALSPAAPPRTAVNLAHFLIARHLDHGVGAYWSASITTVESDGAALVRPVIANSAGRLVRYERQSAASWYTNAPFNFLVYDRAQPWGGVNTASATESFGVPVHTYDVGTYVVLVWPAAHRLSAIGVTGS